MTLEQLRSRYKMYGVLPLDGTGTRARVSERGWLVCDVDLTQSDEKIIADMNEGIATFALERAHKLREYQKSLVR